MEPVLQDRLPTAPWMEAATWRLPGVQPLDPAQWMIRDEAHAGQMALRRHLLATRRAEVLALLPGGRVAARELREAVTGWLAAHDGGPGGYAVTPDRVRCPDGHAVPRAADAAAADAAAAAGDDDPLGDLGRMVQADLCLMVRPEGAAEHVLAGAVLCFPASWSLAEKIGRPLTAIHGPVAAYDGAMAARVQRLFDAVRVGRPLWRQNALIYGDPALFQPRREAAPRRETGGGYLRSERQSFWRLPRTGAVVFAIHTFVVPLDRLSEAQAAGLSAVHHVA